MFLSLVELGWTEKDYTGVAENVRRMKSLPPSQIEELLEEADKKIPREIGLKIIKLRNDSNYDRNFCRIAEIDYSNITQKNQRIIKAAFADYALRVMGFREQSLQSTNF